MTKSSNATAIRLSLTDEVKKVLRVAKKRYPALSDPELLKLGLSKIVTEYDETAELNKNDIRKIAASAIGKDYLYDQKEDIYTEGMGKKVHFL